MRRFILHQLFAWIPFFALGQGYIPHAFGLTLPVTEEFLKSEFSIRYNIRAQQPNMPEALRGAVWDEIKPGEYFASILLEGTLIPELPGLKLVRLTLTRTDELVLPNELTRMQIRSHTRFASHPQDFLLAVDTDKKIHYLSGNVFLDPVVHLLADPADMAAIAKIRMYYLAEDDLLPVGATKGHCRFEAETSKVGRPLIIDLQDQDRFKIFPKGDENHPIAVVGGWSKK